MLLANRYRVVRRLGSGGMASVLLCMDEVLGREVAVKRLHRSDETADVRRLRREARVGAALAHPNLVTVYDTAEDESGALIVMEYVEGHTLADELREGPVEPERALELLRGVAAGLDHAHAAGVVHRDVKPANVLIDQAGTAKLADLGIAQANDTTQTLTGEMIMGTLAYMAPERLRGEESGSPSDVYSLAMVAFETLSGRRARQASTPAGAVHEALNEPAPDLTAAWPDSPPGTSGVIARALHSDPARRTASAGEFVAGIESALASKPEPAMAAALLVETEPLPPETEPLPARTEVMRTPPQRAAAPMGRWVLGALAGGVAVALLIGALGSGGGDPETLLSDRSVAEEQQADSGGSTDAQAGDAGGEQAGGGEPAAALSGAALGAELNDQGYALIQQGSYEEAIPILEQAVAAFGDETSDTSYPYALYNLGYALLHAGRPEDAIPVLEQRMEFPNQRGVVRRTLEEAYAAAGIDAGDENGGGNGKDGKDEKDEGD